MSVIGISALASSAIADPDMSSFNTEDCPGRTTVLPWCASKLSAEGWTLKYMSESNPRVTDVYSLYEIWQREGATVACTFKGGRGGIRVNHCEALGEVDR
jgi:hypothetical protein